MCAIWKYKIKLRNTRNTCLTKGEIVDETTLTKWPYRNTRAEVKGQNQCAEQKVKNYTALLNCVQYIARMEVWWFEYPFTLECILLLTSKQLSSDKFPVYSGIYSSFHKFFWINELHYYFIKSSSWFSWHTKWKSLKESTLQKASWMNSSSESFIHLVLKNANYKSCSMATFKAHIHV